MEPLMAWLSSPIWMGLAVVLLLLVAVIIGMAATHGTTVMKE